MAGDAHKHAGLAELDPRGLIAEAYRMEDPGPEGCRSIFLDWALGRGGHEGTAEALARLHAHYAPRFPDHSMTAVLAEGLRGAPAAPRRRGGRRGR